MSLATIFLIAFGVLGGFGLLLVLGALSDLQGPGADQTLSLGLVVASICLVGAAVVLF